MKYLLTSIILFSQFSYGSVCETNVNTTFQFSSAEMYSYNTTNILELKQAEESSVNRIEDIPIMKSKDFREYTIPYSFNLSCEWKSTQLISKVSEGNVWTNKSENVYSKLRKGGNIQINETSYYPLGASVSNFQLLTDSQDTITNGLSEVNPNQYKEMGYLFTSEDNVTYSIWLGVMTLKKEIEGGISYNNVIPKFHRDSATVINTIVNSIKNSTVEYDSIFFQLIEFKYKDLGKIVTPNLEKINLSLFLNDRVLHLEQKIKRIKIFNLKGDLLLDQKPFEEKYEIPENLKGLFILKINEKLVGRIRIL